MKPAQAETADRILDIAEQHFAENGYAGASLRAIMKEANVNVAAIAYHYGTKEDLFAAVVKRFAEPVVEMQISKLRALDARKPSIEDVTRAFYEAPISMVKSLGENGRTLSLFLGRCQLEPEPVFSLADKQFAHCREQFIAAMRKATPGLTEERYQWNFEFMLSLIVCFLTRKDFVRERYKTLGAWKVDDTVEMLVGFCCGGLSRK